MARVDIGLAGLGRIGRMHAANLATRCGVARLSCVFDADPVVAEKLAGELDVPWTASFEELLEACDAVAVATSTGSHAELTTIAAAGRQAGVLRETDLARPGRVGGHRSRPWSGPGCRSRSGSIGASTRTGSR